MQGWLKLHRKFVNWEWYSDSVVKDVFIHLLLCATHKEREYKGDVLEYGTVHTSLNKLARQLGLSVMQVRTALNKLEQTGEITKTATHKNTIIKVEKFPKYQGLTGDAYANCNKLITQQQQSDNKAFYSSKNDNNDNNDKNVEVCIENIELLKEKYPDVDWDSYEEEDYLVGPTRYKSGRGVVYLSAVQEDMLLEKMENPYTFDEYLGKLAQFIINKDARVKNHYLTILKWYAEDGRISA